ncbi:54S ribosomal protein L11, mitochondrial, variant 2 [Perkinsus olseni]|uniref:54S ribosomal protein L11, mitochondrial, variant 2 n=1 Tax=Perkinsus olseni TaxID=32597 RepID=A0A7J6RDT5_PEROL|nr:54S ribosomal protein L11, mitochondrial, variant 2 [Perkinsus olseni]
MIPYRTSSLKRVRNADLTWPLEGVEQHLDGLVPLSSVSISLAFVAHPMSVIGRFRMWVLAGQSKPSPSVGQTLGPLGINMMQFNKELNARIATVRAKVPVQVTLVPKTDKTYAFWLRTPPANWFIRRVARLPLCGGKGHRNIVGTITLKEVYHIAGAKSMDPTNVGKPLRSIVISVIGTARAMGIQVLYKLPVQHQHRDDLPISDLDRLKKETRYLYRLLGGYLLS